MTRDASLRASASSNSSAVDCSPSSPHQNSYGGRPRKWSNCPNQDTPAMLDSSVIDAGSSVSQTCSAFSAEAGLTHQSLTIPPSLEQELQSNGDDYRPIIDDLTVELQKLKDELNLYKAQGPCLLRNEQLFEIKVNNLPNRKKRELEATLSRFTSNLGNSITSRPRKFGRRVHVLSGSNLERLSSSSSFKTQPQDSAYASMSGGRSSGEISPGQSASMQRNWSAKQNVEKYLCISEDPCQSYVVMTDEERSDWMGDCDSKMTRKHRQETQRLDRCTGESRAVPKEPKVKPQFKNSSNRFHYKPLFVHQASPDGANELSHASSSFGSDDGSIGEI